MTMPSVQQLFDLSGRVAMVTGATGHLGLSMAHALAEAGARVVCTSRMTERVETAAQMITAVSSGAHLGISMDQTSESSMDNAFRSALDTTGHIDILVNN